MTSGRSTSRASIAGVTGLALAAGIAASASAYDPQVVTFNYTGAEQIFQVPEGVTSIHVVAIGGKGGDRGVVNGGDGARVETDLAVDPQDVIRVEVGGNANVSDGGFNGGGNGGSAWSNGGGGGGMTDLQTCQNPCDQQANALLVAAGGGGAGTGGNPSNMGTILGGGNGGGAGDTADPGDPGGHGTDASAAGGGGAGTLLAGGTGGATTVFTPPGCGAPGATAGGSATGPGGAGGGGGFAGGGGGGGGGGYFGGGGGGGAHPEICHGFGTTGGGGGGGAGSNFIIGLSESQISSASGTDNTSTPLVTITYTPADLTAPSITIKSPKQGKVYRKGTHPKANYSCADDEGGSGLHKCHGPVATGEKIAMSLGHHTFKVKGTDLAGNEGTSTVKYVVKKATHH